ncbi:MAG TPA: AmmeMemoRadiSam system protein B [Planctomycetota bacterium]|nr:AmmeMemoRadiSam system protein B [Planctomycetota bacterium]
MPLPPLRPTLRVVPFRHDGRDVFLAIDSHEGLIEHPVVLPPLAFVVASLLDGTREAADVRREIAAKFQGLELTPEEIDAVVRDLDRHFLLESDQVRDRRRAIEDEYRALPARPPRFVQGTPEEVRRELEGYYTAEAGAGRPEARRGEPLAGILAPHIDFRRGGPCYTFAYRELAERSEADLYVILGVAHASPPNPFVVSAKDYETPLGTVSVDREAVATLEKRLGRRIYEHEATHRSEHSIEFQAVFLRHARPDDRFTAVPILCSSFEPWCGDASPSTAPEIEEFLEALREATAGRRVCWVAGVDFAHVGPVFGDDVEIDQELVSWMMAGDNRSLQACAEGNAEAFWNSVQSDGNRRHVCGLSATYAFLRLLGPAEGKIHKYGFAPDPQGGLVSFASLSFRPRT